MNNDYVVLMLIVDQSGSMGTIREESQQALDGLIKDQKEAPGKLGIKLVTFNHVVTLYGLIDAQSFATVDLCPEGMTALHDAMGLGITSLDRELEDLEEKPDKVMVVTLTDGAENSSKEYNVDSIKALVESHRNEKSWDFVFLGANQDAVLTAKQFGIPRGSTLTYAANADGITESMNATARYLGATRSGLKAEFTEEDRTRSGLTDQQ